MDKIKELFKSTSNMHEINRKLEAEIVKVEYERILYKLQNEKREKGA